VEDAYRAYFSADSGLRVTWEILYWVTLMSLVYFKDRFMEESECHISIRDRSFRFGDGMFETMLVVGRADF